MLQAETQIEIVPRIIVMPGVKAIPIGRGIILHVPNTPSGWAAAKKAEIALRAEYLQRAA